MTSHTIDLTGIVPFTEAYYQAVVRQHGYSTFDLRRFDFAMAGMDEDELNWRWLCHHDAARYAATPRPRRIVTTGFGMSGPPHMGTAAQVLSMIRLQQGGEHCQIVLGDLDAYNGRNTAYSHARELAERFAVFAGRLGYDTSHGILRDQSTCTDALAAMYAIGRYATDQDFLVAEEDNHSYYAARGIVDATMTFRRRLSLTLMAADFITLGQSWDAVLILLGIDEHKYVRFARQLTSRLDDAAPLRAGFALAAIYSRLTAGFNGHPKFSKSIPGSSISVDTPAHTIRDLIRSDEAADPAASPVYQLMCQMAYRDASDLTALYRACARGSPQWTAEKTRFADYLIHIKELWP